MLANIDASDSSETNPTDDIEWKRFRVLKVPPLPNVDEGGNMLLGGFDVDTESSQERIPPVNFSRMLGLKYG